MIASFDVGDLIGKVLPVWYCAFSHRTILLPLIFQSLFPFLFWLALKPSTFDNDTLQTIFGSDEFDISIAVLLGISTGYIGCCAMMLGPQRVEEHERETAGMLDTFFLICGLFGGSLVGLLLQHLIVS